MREIKFRLWDGEVMSEITYMKLPISYCDPVVMQYTGLKDKNGKEIYEGDIIKGVAEHVGQGNVFYGYGVWQPFSFLGTYQGSEFEIIGNIYENPELIEHE